MNKMFSLSNFNLRNEFVLFIARELEGLIEIELGFVGLDVARYPKNCEKFIALREDVIVQ